MNQTLIALDQLTTRQPIRFDPDLPDEVLTKLTGVRGYSRASVPFYGADERVAENPALKLRPSETPGEPGTWMIVDRLDTAQRAALGEFQSRVRRSTGCREDDRDGAAAAFLAYVKEKRARIAARLLPEHVPLGAILTAYQLYLDGGAHTLSASAVESYSAQLVPVVEFFGPHPLGALTPNRQKDYEDWRGRQTVHGYGKKPISKTEIKHELATLRQGINWFQKGTPLNFNYRFYAPARDTAPVVWWTRREMARFLWACRGRIAVVTRDARGKALAWRWRIARDDDPSLTGPEGDRRVLRPAEEIVKRQAVARWAIAGVYTASRARVQFQTTWRETSEQAYVSFLEGLIRRKAIGVVDNLKRRPPVALGAKIGRFAVNWAVADGLPNRWRNQRAMHVLHQANGASCSKSQMRRLVMQVRTDSGVDKLINSLILRHIAAMWLKIEGVSAWLAGQHLGCSAETIETRYGTFDDHGPFEIADALARGAKQKAAARRLAAAGLADVA